MPWLPFVWGTVTPGDSDGVPVQEYYIYGYFFRPHYFFNTSVHHSRDELMSILMGTRDTLLCFAINKFLNVGFDVFTQKVIARTPNTRSKGR